MRQLTVIGFLGQDARVSQHNNKSIINFSIADSEKFKNAEGVEVTKTTWIECAIWKDAGQSVLIANYLKKGTQVFVQGTPDVSTYTNKENKVVAKLSLRVSNTQLLGSAPKPEPTNGNVAPNDTIHHDANFGDAPNGVGTDGKPLPF